MESRNGAAVDLKDKDELKEGSSVEAMQSMNWSIHLFARYTKSYAPAMPVVDTMKVEELAREKLKNYPGAFMYGHGSAGTGATEKANRVAFDKLRIIPRMMRNCTSRSTEVTLFGKRYASPLLLAPIGVQGIIHPDAELATARAARKVGVPMIMSTASSRSIEDVAEANGGGDRWFQLYWLKTPEVAISILNRAAQCGFTTLVVTVDTTTIGWRPHDLERKYFPFGHGTGCAVGASDETFMRLHGYSGIKHNKYVEFPYDPDELERRAEEGDEDVKERMRFGNMWSREMNSGLFRTWEDIRFLREHWSGPIVAKGLQCVEDAEMAMDFVDGIVVSNHGGRQIDGAIASLDALDEICTSEKIKDGQQSGKFAVLFDSGIRTGSDMIKALALGAQAVLLGRPYLYGLTIAGEAGVEEQVRNILADFEVTMGLCGFSGVQDVVGNRTALMMV